MSNKAIEFSEQDIYVGIDVHKKPWSVSVLSQDMEHKTFDQALGTDILEAYLTKHCPRAETIGHTKRSSVAITVPFMT